MSIETTSQMEFGKYQKIVDEKVKNIKVDEVVEKDVLEINAEDKLEILLNEKEKKYITFKKNADEYIVELKWIDSRKLLINEILKDDEDFKRWYINMIFMYYKTNDYSLINYKKLFEFADQYTEKSKDLDFSSFVNKSKKTKNSIFFEIDEIKNTYKLSLLLKLVAALYSNINTTREIKNDIFSKIIEKVGFELVNKIYTVVKSKMWKFSFNDQYMWRLFKIKSIMDEKTFLLFHFNFIITAVIVNYNLKNNPITFIASSIGDMIKWFLNDLHVESIIYEENNNAYLQVTTDIEHKIIYNSLNRMEIYVYKKLQELNFDVKKVEEKLENETCRNNFIHSFTLPIVSKITGIPLRELLSRNLKKQFTYQLFVYFLFKEIEEYKDYKFVEYFKNIIHIKDNSQIVYKPKNVIDLFNNSIKFYGTNDKNIILKLFSSIMISISKYTYTEIFGAPLKKGKTNNAEVDLLEKQVLEFIKFICSIESNDSNPIFNKLNSKYIELIKNQ